MTFISTRLCCPECFDDHSLRDQLFPSLDPCQGTCDFCKTHNTQLVDPKKLADYFELLVNAYEPKEGGKLLVEWMKADWMLFTHSYMDIDRATELLGEILNDREIAQSSYVPSTSYISKGLIQWDKLRDELMHTNRWFLDIDVDEDRLKQLLDMLIAPSLPQKWYRARIFMNKALSIEEMGAPPKRLSSNGRANPAGIPYLYLGSRPDTAVAEIRPHTGEQAYVADFMIKDVKVVDLCNPRKLVSPLILTDASEIAQLRADLPFLERLGEELTRPVPPAGAAIDYIPSQYLCEFIKKKGFDGVIYRSSISEGINLALFNSAQAEGGNVLRYDVTQVSVAVKASEGDEVVK